jgi:hypothetical protein
VSNACWVKAALRDKSVGKEIKILWKHFSDHKIKKKRDQKAQEKKTENELKADVRSQMKAKADALKAEKDKKLRDIEKTK